MEHYTTIGKDDILQYGENWLELEDNILSELIQRGRTTTL